MNNTHTITQLSRLPAIKTATGRSKSSIYRDINTGLFPKPVIIGATSAWPANEVQTLIRARVAGWSDDQIRELVSRLHAARAESAPDMPVAGGVA